MELFHLARLFGEPMEHLLGLVQHAPEEDLVMLRAETITPSTRAELRSFVNLCQEYEQLEEWAEEAREPDLRSIRAILSTYEQARTLAAQERKRLDLGATPAHQLVTVLEENVGVKVLFLDVNDAISGAAITSPSFGAAILVNRKHPAGRRAFTLAHEYFHLLTRGRVARSQGAQAVHLCQARAPDGGEDRGEQLADQFAAEFLMPSEHFVERVRELAGEDKTIDPVDLIGVARYFGVSVQAVFVRMAALRMITWERAKKEYERPEVQEEILRRGAREQAPEPMRFKRLAVKAYLADQISRARLAELLHVNVADVEAELSRFGGEDKGLGVKLSLPR